AVHAAGARGGLGWGPGPGGGGGAWGGEKLTLFPGAGGVRCLVDPLLYGVRAPGFPPAPPPPQLRSAVRHLRGQSPDHPDGQTLSSALTASTSNVCRSPSRATEPLSMT